MIRDAWIWIVILQGLGTLLFSESPMAILSQYKSVYLISRRRRGDYKPIFT
jgi:hypothetical protein